MTLPPNFSFELQMTYNGREQQPIPYESREKIKALDPYFDKRSKCKEKILDGMLRHFALFLHKYPILKRILQEKNPPNNITLLNIVEDALKQNITDLADIMTSFIEFLNECKGKYQVLFKKKSQHKIMENLINGATSDNQELLRNRIKEIDLKRGLLFNNFNSKGTPSDKDFDDLKAEVQDCRNMAKSYRDKIAAHDDGMQLFISWERLDTSIDQFKNLIYDFYTVLSFEMKFGGAYGPGLMADKTLEFLLKEIYQ